MNKALVFSLLILAQAVVLAAGGGAHDENHIPYSTIFFQFINLGILLIGLFFAIRKSVVELFQSRFFNYNDQAQKTAEASKLAEAALSDIKSKIHTLQNSESQSIENAKKDAEVLKNKLISEAKSQSEKIKTDTQLIVAAVLNNAKNEIRKEIINASLEIAKSNIKNDSAAITKKSEKGFLQDLANTKNQVTL